MFIDVSGTALKSRNVTVVIPQLQKILASDWLFSSVFFFNIRAKQHCHPGIFAVRLFNSTVIRELSTIFFRQLISGGLYLGEGVYIRGFISGRLVSWGLIFEGLIYPGAYIPGAYIRGLITGNLYPGNFYPGDFYPGAAIRELITGELISGGLYRARGLHPGLISGGLLSRGPILHTDNF